MRRSDFSAYSMHAPAAAACNEFAPKLAQIRFLILKIFIQPAMEHLETQYFEQSFKQLKKNLD